MLGSNLSSSHASPRKKGVSPTYNSSILIFLTLPLSLSVCISLCSFCRIIPVCVALRWPCWPHSATSCRTNRLRRWQTQLWAKVSIPGRRAPILQPQAAVVVAAQSVAAAVAVAAQPVAAAAAALDSIRPAPSRRPAPPVRQAAVAVAVAAAEVDKDPAATRPARAAAAPW